MIASLASLLSVSALLANTVSAAPLAHVRESLFSLAARGKDNWWSGLEPYDTYHARYLSFDCQNYHNTEYFTSCCNPLLKDQSVDSLPSACQAGGLATSSSSEYVEPSSSSWSRDDAATPASDYYVPTTSEWVAPTTTSEWVAPTTTSEWVAPTTTSEWVAPTTSEWVAPTTSEWVAPTTSEWVAPTTSAWSSGSGTNSGSGTYFYQNGVAGACGTVHGDYDKIVALETSMYANGANCGKYITLYRNGASVTAMVADECPTCVSATSVDMSVGTFLELGTEDEGMFDITWSFD